MDLTDVRRLTGANLVLNRPGAAAEVLIKAETKSQVIEIWRAHMSSILDAVGWAHEDVHVRNYKGGATLAITGPIDALYAATDLIEAVWDLTKADIAGAVTQNFDAKVSALKDLIAEERDPALLNLAEAAREKGLTLLSDDDHVSLGLGRFGQTWARGNIPDPSSVDWAQLNDMPVALVTGTNGKSTTVRLAAAISMAAGRTAGFSSSDWVRAGDEIIATGDYSGPEGARLALRHSRVDMAIIETARGGLLRRGLPIPKAQACLITNIASDHLGEYGIHDVAALADVKFTVAKAVSPDGALVLNADDLLLVERAESFVGRITWYGLSIEGERLKTLNKAGHDVAYVKDGVMMWWPSARAQAIAILPVTDFPAGLGGAASYNVCNALGAIALTAALGIAPDFMTSALRAFESTPEDNPGRGNFLEVGGVSVLVDFAHNPHAISALATAMSAVPANRRLYLLGQAGDRSDQDIRDMSAAVCAANPDVIIVKELLDYLRGRQPGEIPAIIRDELAQCGFPQEFTLHADSELEAVKTALEWAKPCDLLVCLVYQDRQAVLDLLGALKSRGWAPGQELD